MPNKFFHITPAPSTWIIVPNGCRMDSWIHVVCAKFRLCYLYDMVSPSDQPTLLSIDIQLGELVLIVASHFCFQLTVVVGWLLLYPICHYVQSFFCCCFLVSLSVVSLHSIIVLLKCLLTLTSDVLRQLFYTNMTWALISLELLFQGSDEKKAVLNLSFNDI